MGGRVEGHANWKTIEEESRKLVTIAKYVAQGAPGNIVEEDL